jgi:hypothetical protein
VLSTATGSTQFGQVEGSAKRRGHIRGIISTPFSVTAFARGTVNRQHNVVYAPVDTPTIRRHSTASSHCM